MAVLYFSVRFSSRTFARIVILPVPSKESSGLPALLLGT